MKKYSTIIFDLDGTLLDTLEDITDAVNETFKCLNMDYFIDTEITRHFIGSGARILVDRIFNYLSIDEKLKESYYSNYLNMYSKHVNVKTEPYPNVIETLQKLKEKGYILGVISNKPNRDVSTCLNKYFKDIFDFYTGQVGNILPKPHADIFYYLKEKFPFIKENILFVGDMLVDIEFSKNIHADCAIYENGYGKIKSCKEANFLFEKYMDLLKVLED